MLLYVFYEGMGWTKVHVPDEGKAVLYPSGLLNILDRSGRCVSAPPAKVNGVLHLAPAGRDLDDNHLQTSEQIEGENGVAFRISRMFDQGGERKVENPPPSD